MEQSYQIRNENKQENGVVKYKADLAYSELSDLHEFWQSVSPSYPRSGII